MKRRFRIEGEGVLVASADPQEVANALRYELSKHVHYAGDNVLRVVVEEVKEVTYTG